MFRPLAREVATFAESLNIGALGCRTGSSMRQAGESMWTADRLAVHVRAHWKMADSSWFRTVSPTCTYGAENPWK